MCKLSLLTDKSPLVCQRAIIWIGESGAGKHGLVFLETHEPYTHLRYDAGKDGPEAFVKSTWGLSSDSRDGLCQALCLTLGKCSELNS